MKSTIERTYSLGQYQNIKIQNEIFIDDSDENKHMLKQIQLIDLELTFLDYVNLLKDSEHLSFEDRLEFLNSIKEKLEEDYSEHTDY